MRGPRANARAPRTVSEIERYERGTRGRFEPEQGLHLNAAHPVTRAWQLAFRAQRSRAEPDRIAMPTPAELDVAGDSPAAAHPLLLAVGEAIRDALVRFDGSRAEALLARCRAIELSGETMAIERALIELWCEAFALPTAVSGPEDATALARRARDAEVPRLVIEATALGSLLTLAASDASEALASARVASRMARTEALPQPEYLANLVLARLRRVCGKPHLAVHILRALARAVPMSWSAVVAFERGLAGDRESGDPAIEGLCAAAATSDEAAARAAMATLRAGPGALPPNRATVETLIALLVPHAPSPSGAEGWLDRGDEGDVPLGLHGLALHHPDPVFQSEPIWVHGVAGGGARRLLSPGLGLLPPELGRLAPGQRGRARTDGAIAMLLFATAPIPEPEFFEALYGFRYKPANHQGARDTLYYRIRSRLEGVGELERSDAGLALRLKRSVAAPDPRFRPPPESALLTLVAQLGNASARETAKRLGIPLRTAQHSLKALAADGVCVVERAGRELRYRVEDTTFCTPTTAI